MTAEVWAVGAGLPLGWGGGSVGPLAGALPGDSETCRVQGLGRGMGGVPPGERKPPGPTTALKEPQSCPE